MSTNTISMSGEFHPDVLQLQRANSGAWSSFSYDGTDLISFEDGTCATEISSRPPSSTSFLDDATEATGTQVNQSNNDGSVYVTVSGTSFSVPRDVFVKMDKLNWVQDRNGNWQLNTSPAIFEILLGYMMFETLPAIDTLSKAEYNEFEPMALSVGLQELVEHFDRSSDKRLRSNNNSSRRRSMKQKYKGVPIVLNSENVSATSVKLMAANSKCTRFFASLKRKGSNRFRARRTKMTHEQLCASSHVN